MKKILLLTFLLFISAFLMGSDVIDSLKTEIEKSTGQQKIELLITLADVYSVRNPEDGINYAVQAYQLAESNGMRELEAKANTSRGALYLRLGNFDNAEKCLTEALNYFTETKQDSISAKVYTNLGLLHRNKGDLDRALFYYEKSLHIKNKQDDPYGTSTVLGGIGLIYYDQGDFETAKEYFRRAVELGKKSKSKQALTHALNNLGLAYARNSEFDSALEYYLEALKYSLESDYNLVTASTYNNMANIHYMVGDIELAKENLVMALEIYRNIGNKVNIARTLNNLALIAQDEKSYQDAIALYEEALQIRRELGNDYETVNSLNNLASLYELMDELPKALELYLESYEKNKILKDSWNTAYTLNNIGIIYSRMEIYSVALDMLKEAYNIALENDHYDILKDITDNMAAIYTLTNNYEQAYTYLQKFGEIKDTLNARSNTEKLNEIRIKYETGQKDRENELLKKDLEISSLEIFHLILLLIASILVLAVVVVFFVLRLRTNKELKVSNKDLAISKENTEQIRKQLALVNSMLRHDLANDFIVIKTALKLYAEEKDEKMLREADIKCDKGLELINTLRNFESNSSNGNVLKPIDLKQVIDKITTEFSGMNIQLKGNCKVRADEALESVIYNIIENARVHGNAKIIIISTQEFSDFTEIKICNDGTQIPTEIHERIFEKGFISGDAGHTGMGLFLVKQNINRYGGSISVENNDDRGVTFVINLKKV
jgi:tetratricopeptide (TPR) repeat protein